MDTETALETSCDRGGRNGRWYLLWRRYTMEEIALVATAGDCAIIAVVGEILMGRPCH